MLYKYLLLESTQMLVKMETIGKISIKTLPHLILNKVLGFKKIFKDLKNRYKIENEFKKFKA